MKIVKLTAMCGVAVLVMARLPLILAQAPPDFSGAWKLDPNRSRVAEAVGFAGLIPKGAPGTLHITQPANGTLIIESQINEGHSRIYRPGGKTSTPSGPGSTITMTSRWEGRTLVGEGTQQSASGASQTVREVLAFGADAQTLTIDVTSTGPGGSSASSLVYTRTQAAEPCQNWPTPCKAPSPAGGPGLRQEMQYTGITFVVEDPNRQTAPPRGVRR